jgi:glutathione S-transferase
MAIVLYHHPFSRAANVVWMLEEVGVDYELRHIDIMKGAQKAPEILALNPMGKLPILVDGDTVVTESAAIGLFLADRYGYGRLAPRVDDPSRGTYLRWSFFAPSVIEPGSMAKAGGWAFREGQAGWGSHDAMLAAMESAIAGKDFVLGTTFSMADVVFGGTVRFMLGFKMIEPRPILSAYAERLGARPALQKADARNAASMAEHGIKPA